MKAWKRGITGLILLIICIFVHIYSRDSERVESYYSNGFFIHLSGFLRRLTGSIPFSIGDIFYGLAVLWLIWKLVKWIRNRKTPKKHPFFYRIRSKLYKVFVICCVLYIVFNVFWGINYNRKGIAAQLGLNMEKYTGEQLKDINCLLIEKINVSKSALIRQNEPYPGNQKLFSMVTASYDNVSKQYPFLKYTSPSIKSSLWGWLGNYAGFTGYYNPFTAEAQVNTTVPAFLQPFVSCHEVAHQLGYAKEMEANFVGYLAARSSSDTLIHYSVYLDLFAYANKNLFRTDSVTARLYYQELSLPVMKDLEEWRKFSKRHRNPVEPVIRWMYGKFLQSNQQPQGILSYDEVTAFIIAYYKKFGKI